MEGDFSWHGLVLVIGQGAMRWPVTAVGQISGAVFISRTRAEDRDAGNPLGSLLATPGPVTADFSGGGIVAFDTAELERAHQSLPYVVIASRERM